MANPITYTGQKPLVFVRVSWLHNYQGDADPAIATGDVNIFEDFSGCDIFNFAPSKISNYQYELRYYIDYVGDRLEKPLQFSKAKIKTDLRYHQPLCVVLIARKPGTRDEVIVGWYKNATFFNDTQKDVYEGQEPTYYIAHAPIEKASRLLPVKNRNFKIKADTKQPVFFHTELTPGVVTTIWDYINQFPD